VGKILVKRLKSALILLVGIGLCYWFARRLEWHQVETHLRDASILPLVVAALLINLTLLARSLRWQAFLDPIARIRLPGLFAATAIGFGSVFIFGRAGEIVRPMVLSLRERIRPSATIATILIERVYDMTAVVALFAVNLLFLEPTGSSGFDARALTSMRYLGGLLLLGVCAGVAALVFLRLRATHVNAWMSGLAERWFPRVMRPLANLVSHLTEGLAVLLNLRELALTLMYTLFVWGLVTTSTWLVLVAFGLHLQLTQVIFVLGFGLVGSVVPTPGGSAGAFHAAAAASLIFLGFDRNLAASVAIVFHLIAFGPPFLIGLFYLVRDGLGLNKLREMIAQETEGRLEHSTG
jgi:glycosyltransferase 2 family protein